MKLTKAKLDKEQGLLLSFEDSIRTSGEKIVKAMKDRNVKGFTQELTDISGKVYELTVKIKTP